MLKSHMSLCVSFSRTDVGLCIYHLVVRSNFNFLHNSQWITLPTQSCLVLYPFCANLLRSLITWLIVSSLSPHNLHLLFCFVLCILALICLVLMALFCATWGNLLSHKLQELPLWTWVDLRVMAMKGYISQSSRTGSSLSDYLVSYSGLWLRKGDFILCRDAVSVFYCPSRLDNQEMVNTSEDVRTNPKWHSSADFYVWTYQCWPASKSLYSSILCVHWMSSRGSTK